MNADDDTMIGYLALEERSRWWWRAVDLGMQDPQTGQILSTKIPLEKIVERGAPSLELRGGGSHTTIFKTVNNAMATAGPQGRVLVLDLSKLSEITYEALDDATKKRVMKRWIGSSCVYLNRHHVTGQNVLSTARLSLDPADMLELAKHKGVIEHGKVGIDDIYVQHQHAERQMDYWAARVKELGDYIAREKGG